MTKEELAAIRQRDAQYGDELSPIHAPGEHTMDCQCEEIQAVLDRRALLAHLGSPPPAGDCSTPHVLPESLRLSAAWVDLEPQRNSDAEMMREAANYIEELESRDHCRCEACQRSRREALAAEAQGWRALTPSTENGYSDEVKQAAYKLDPECWVSYSGKPKKFKSYMETRRVASLNKASALIGRQKS